MRPSRDPNIPHPGMEFIGGCWRNTDSAERQREYQRNRTKKQKWNPKYNERRNERRRQRRIIDPEWVAQENERNRTYAKKIYWSDPFRPLQQQQRQNEWRARKREEALRGR